MFRITLLRQRFSKRSPPRRSVAASPIGQASLSSLRHRSHRPIRPAPGSSCTSRNTAYDARRDGGARQRLDELCLPARRRSGCAGQLQCCGSRRRLPASRSRARRPSPAHIHHQVVIAERRPALGQQNAIVPGGSHLFRRQPNIGKGRDELAFLDRSPARPVRPASTRMSVCRHRNAGICRMSTASAAFSRLRGLVYVGDPPGIAALARHGSAFSKPRPSFSLGRC